MPDALPSGPLDQIQHVCASRGPVEGLRRLLRLPGSTAELLLDTPDWSPSVLRALLDPASTTALGAPGAAPPEGEELRRALAALPVSQLALDDPAQVVQYLQHPEPQVRYRLVQYHAGPGAPGGVLRFDPERREYLRFRWHDQAHASPARVSLQALPIAELQRLWARETDPVVAALLLRHLPRTVLDLPALIEATTGLRELGREPTMLGTIAVVRDDADTQPVAMDRSSAVLGRPVLFESLLHRPDLHDTELHLLLGRGGPSALWLMAGGQLLRALVWAFRQSAGPEGARYGPLLAALRDPRESEEAALIRAVEAAVASPAALAVLDPSGHAALLRLVNRDTRLRLIATLGATRTGATPAISPPGGITLAAPAPVAGRSVV